MNRFIKGLAAGTAALGLIGFAGASCINYLTAPEVHMSYSTKKCVKLVDYQGNDLPCSEAKNYKMTLHVWVQ